MAIDKYWSIDQGKLDITAVADEAFGQSFLVCKQAADGDVGVADAATDALIGVAQTAADSGAQVTVRVQGISYARIASGSINAGVPVTAASGGYIAAASDGNFVIGKTMAQATGVDSVVPILLLPGAYQIEDVV